MYLSSRAEPVQVGQATVIWPLQVRLDGRIGVVDHRRPSQGIVRNLGDPASSEDGKRLRVKSEADADGVSGVGSAHSSGVAG